MQIKLLIDVNESKTPVIRITNPKGAHDSDDVKDKLTRIFLEEIGQYSGLVSIYYTPEGDAILKPAEHHIAIATLASRFSEGHKVNELLNEALEELNKLPHAN